MLTTLIKPKRIFNECFVPFLSDMTRTQVFFGGSSSGKSKFLAQRCVKDICEGGQNYLIVRNVGNSLRKSTFNEVCKVISEWNLGGKFKINVGDMAITCVNGYQILFNGLDDVEKLKSIAGIT